MTMSDEAEAVSSVSMIEAVLAGDSDKVASADGDVSGWGAITSCGYVGRWERTLY